MLLLVIVLGAMTSKEKSKVDLQLCLFSPVFVAWVKTHGCVATGTRKRQRAEQHLAVNELTVTIVTSPRAPLPNMHFFFYNK